MFVLSIANKESFLQRLKTFIFNEPFQKRLQLLLLLLLESQFLDSLLCFGKDETVMNMKINCSTSILYILSFFGMMHPNMKYTLYKLLFFISTSKIEVVLGEKKNPQLLKHLNFLLSNIGFFLSFHIDGEFGLSFLGIMYLFYGTGCLVHQWLQK